MHTIPPYKAKNKIRVVTASSLFDGHDASINIMRRIIQATGAEVIHLGHDRSVTEVVNCAIQEDAHAIALTSYQGGHNEYFRFMVDLLKEKGAGHIKIFGGGGGVILPTEIKSLMDYGVTRIYSPDDGREMGLQGMINDLMEKSDFALEAEELLDKEEVIGKISSGDHGTIARAITLAETHPGKFNGLFGSVEVNQKVPVLGITGTGGAGKSTLVDELIRRFLDSYEDLNIGIISVDPTKRKSGGALLGDRIRMNAIDNDRVYMQSLATRQTNMSLSKNVTEAIKVMRASNIDIIILETSGIGQSGTEVLDHSDFSLYVMTPEFGAATQLEKIDMLDFANMVAINKFDKRGAKDALRAVKRQYIRNHNLFDQDPDDMPVYGTVASRFNDYGTNLLFEALVNGLNEKTEWDRPYRSEAKEGKGIETVIIPPERNRYLAEISAANRSYGNQLLEQSELMQQLYAAFLGVGSSLRKGEDRSLTAFIGEQGFTLTHLEPRAKDGKQDRLHHQVEAFNELFTQMDSSYWQLLLEFWKNKKDYAHEQYVFKVRDKEIHMETTSQSLAKNAIPRISFPKFKAWGDLTQWLGQENIPGYFPFTAGIYPFKRKGEDPTRMFAGEGGPERTNKRFHYLSLNMPAKRLSTAFDSVTLYGRDPGPRPDIYGKIGNAGVSVCCLDDAKKLYSGFDLSNPKTSVSMTINGPAPMVLAFFLNAAIDQNCEKYIGENGLKSEVQKKIDQLYKDAKKKRPQYHGELPEGHNGLGLMLLGVTGDQVLADDVYGKIKAATLAQVRGTVQADILKEDQAQNTCIFSTEFALKLMGDVQEYFIENKVRNFYSVSVSGYHIAEAGANPITQLAFTLANGFTYVEYYLSRGMDINEFGPNLSFFFSNGLDPEYAVIGRVARRIWGKAMKLRYGAGKRAQMLKYHIQTSGRSLHAQEIDFNDIRTTLQALYAIYDNCNSLHTNAYDEAITTPTEDSVRRAMAIQLIINKELGLTKNENPLQGSFIIEELTDLVEEAVLVEFERISERGGVLGAMENMYQRSKIQEESLYYEHLKHSGEHPVVGVNTFISSDGSPTLIPDEVIRSDRSEKDRQIEVVENLKGKNTERAAKSLRQLRQKALQNENTFHEIIEAAKYCSLGQLSETLFQVGGQYRRNM